MFKGSNVALVTPFKNNKLDDDNYIELIHFHIKNGTNGLVPAGTTGESPTLSHKEHEKVIELCINETKGKIPVIADCDTGYGGPNNVSHMVKKYESAGIAAICIEDKTFPKQNSLLENGQNDLISEKEFVAKIIAAKEAKQDKNFMIIARIEALISGAGMDEALKRATAYEKAGADAILIHSKKKTPEEVFEFAELWKGNSPIVVIPTTYDSVSLDELISHKIKIVIHANQTFRAAHASMSRILKQMINSNSLSEVKEEISSMEDIFHLQEMYNLKEKEITSSEEADNESTNN